MTSFRSPCILLTKIQHVDSTAQSNKNMLQGKEKKHVTISVPVTNFQSGSRLFCQTTLYTIRQNILLLLCRHFSCPVSSKLRFKNYFVLENQSVIQYLCMKTCPSTASHYSDLQNHREYRISSDLPRIHSSSPAPPIFAND